MKRVLITGITGFVGTNLVKGLGKRSENTIYGLSRDPKKAGSIFQNLSVTILQEYSTDLIDQNKIDGVIHLAGIAHDLSNRFKPEDYYQVNFENTKRLYDSFLKSNASQFIFLSSIKAVIDTSTVPVEENVQPNPVTDYGKSKLKAEQYIQSQPLPDTKQFYILRPCMVHGPGNKGNLNLLYRFVNSGIPYPLAAFANQRSFLSIDNLAFILQKIMEGNIPSGVYHVADNGFLSTRELYEIIAEANGKKPKIWTFSKSLIQFLSTISGNRKRLSKLTESLLVSNAKLLTNLNCQLPVGIRAGLTKTIKSFRE